MIEITALTSVKALQFFVNDSEKEFQKKWDRSGSTLSFVSTSGEHVSLSFSHCSIVSWKKSQEHDVPDVLPSSSSEAPSNVAPRPQRTPEQLRDISERIKARTKPSTLPSLAECPSCGENSELVSCSLCGKEICSLCSVIDIKTGRLYCPDCWKITDDEPSVKEEPLRHE